MVLGDSLSFGRPSHDIGLEDTWPFKLDSEEIQVVYRAKAASTSTDVLWESRTLAAYWRPKKQRGGGEGGEPFAASIVQVGIVDVAPRLLPRAAYNLLRRYRVTAYVVNKLSRNQNIMRLYGKPWVGIEKFRKNIRDIRASLLVLSKDCFFLEILKPNAYLIENCGDFSPMVSSYNAVLKEELGNRFIEVSRNDVPPLLLPDGHHLNHAGHVEVARVVSRAIKARFPLITVGRQT